MPCYVTTDEAGTTIVCERGSRRRQTCAIAGCQRWSDRLCDWSMGKSVFGQATPKTCDRPMCSSHATSVGPNRDYCPDHANHAVAR